MRRASFVLLAVVLIGFAGCAASAQQKTIRAAFVGINATRDGWRAWEQAHYHALVKSATSHADGMAKLEAFEADQRRVWAGISIAYDALRLAVSEASQRNIDAALLAIERVVAIIRELEEPPPGAASQPASEPRKVTP